MAYDRTCALWPQSNESYFRDRTFRVLRQSGPACVSNVLAMLTGQTPDYFQGIINTQDPVSWSEALRPWNMKLACCPTDIRKLKYYMRELVELDDLFTLSYYTTNDANILLGNPSADGWLTGSHIVILHRNLILDSGIGEAIEAFDHVCNEYHTKRIFRVVPANHPRGL